MTKNGDVIQMAPGGEGADNPQGPANAPADNAQNEPDDKGGPQPSGQDSPEIPEKFRGKSPDEIMRSYAELESEKGRLAAELGKVRNTLQGLERLSVMQNVQREPAESESTIEEKIAALHEEFEAGNIKSEAEFEAKKALLIREDAMKLAVEHIRQNLLAEREEIARREFASKNPDFVEMYHNPDSPMRQLMDSNPVLAADPVGAYYAVKVQQAHTAKEQEVAQARKDAYEAALAEFKKTLGGSADAESVLGGSEQSLRNPEGSKNPFEGMTPAERKLAVAKRAGIIK